MGVLAVKAKLVYVRSRVATKRGLRHRLLGLTLCVLVYALLEQAVSLTGRASPAQFPLPCISTQAPRHFCWCCGYCSSISL
jgi:hypothetical protein